MSVQKNYIDDLTNFNGNLHELKQIVDYLYESYGWHSSVEFETIDECINFAVIQEMRH